MRRQARKKRKLQVLKSEYQSLMKRIEAGEVHSLFWRPKHRVVSVCVRYDAIYVRDNGVERRMPPSGLVHFSETCTASAHWSQ